MSKGLSEQEVLRKLNIPNFRHMTKDKVMDFASMMHDMDPAVAIKAIEQFPHFAKLIEGTLRDYESTVRKAIDANNESDKQCMRNYTIIIDTLKAFSERDDIDIETRIHLVELMVQVVEKADQKDRENKVFLGDIVKDSVFVRRGCTRIRCGNICPHLKG